MPVLSKTRLNILFTLSGEMELIVEVKLCNNKESVASRLLDTDGVEAVHLLENDADT